MNARRILEFTAAVLIAVVIAVCIRVFLFQPFPVPSRSMEPAICAMDEILVFKGAYLLKRFGICPVARGSVVVFEGKREADGYFVKRIIGIPGDRIVIKDGNVSVNGKVMDGSATAGELSMTIPDRHVFLLGDNRAVSEDSRTYGPVHTDRVIGTALIIYKPLARFGTVR